jgi:uncharacterized protein YbaP (TraB family)
MARPPFRAIVPVVVLFGWAVAACGPRRTPTPTSPAPAARTALLWRVTHGSSVSYLFGTIHTGLALDDVLGPAGRRLLAASRVLYVEMDLSDPARARALGAAAVQSGMLPPGESLQRMLSPSDWTRLQRMLPTSSPAVLDRLQPWLAALSTVQAIAASGNASARTGPQAGPPMDVALVSEARAWGVPVLELDSMQQQLDAFTSMPRDAALAMLRELLASPERASGELRAIVDAYASTDAERQLTRLVEQMARRTPVFAEYLLFRRTRRWADALAGPLGAGGVFVAVGAGHLVGPQGLPALLARRGFEVRRVDARSAACQIEQVVESRGLVRTDHELLEDPEPGLRTPPGTYELLHVKMRQRILAPEVPDLPIDDVVALPGAVPPLPAEVAEPPHREDEDGLQLDRHRLATRCDEPDGRRRRPSCPGAPTHAVLDTRELVHRDLTEAICLDPPAALEPGPPRHVLRHRGQDAVALEMERCP